MAAVRSVAFGCCVLSTVAGLVRIFWPENGFKPVINAVLALYIITAAVQIIRVADWAGIAAELAPASDSSSVSDSEVGAYRRTLTDEAAAQALRDVLAASGIEAAIARTDTGWQVTLVHAADSQKAEALLAANCGTIPYEITAGGAGTMKVDLSALWQTLTKRTAALLADEQKRTGLLVAVGLLGLVLLGVSSWLPAKSKPETTAPMPQSTITSDYEAHLEARLQTLISNLAGAGETRVMVTLQCGEESIYAADTETSADGTAASKHVITGGTGLVETIQTPQVQGVAVLCQGGEDPAVQTRITALVQALTGVGANHVTVAALADAIPHN